MDDLSIDEKVSLLITKWNRIDAPARFRWCARLRPYHWYATVGVHRYLDHIGYVRRSQVASRNAYQVRLLWIEVWWYRW